MSESTSDYRRMSSSSSSSHHDTLQPPVATNVQVAARCRPLNSREKSAGRGAVVQCKPNSCEVAIVKRKTYTFDRVFSQYSTQKDVFTSVVKPAVDEALAGYNCTVFAYGQTGTGKTYTMQGDLSPDSDMAGIIPRSVAYIFDALKASNGEFSVRVSFLQLYNEELKDLLDPDTEKKMRLMEDTKRGGIYCMNLLEVTATTANHVYELVNTGVKNRMTSETLMNENSSRSHSIFTIRIHSKEHNAAGEDMLRVGQLNLVDLAGSECVGRSGARNARAREAGTINQSLLTLGRVITALVDNLPHVPYRDSKLTRLLQESLGGRAKTTIIATLAPCADSLDETLSTLEYAFRAKYIKNKPQLNQKMTKAGLLNDFESEIEMLRAALHAARMKDGVYLPLEQFTDMQERLAGQAVQVTELEDILKEKNTSCKELEEQAKLHASEVTALKSDKQALRDKITGVQEELTMTKLDLERTNAKLQQVQSVLKAFQDNEQELLARGVTAAKLYDASEKRAAQLLAKIENTQRVEEANTELANSFHNNSQLKLNSFQERIEKHKESQETMFQDISSALRELKTAHSMKLDEFVTSLNAMQNLLQARRLQTADSRIEDEAQTSEQREEVKRAMQKQQEAIQKQLEKLVETVKCHATAIMEELSTSKSRNVSLLECMQSELEVSRKDFATFFADHCEKLHELKMTIDSSVMNQSKELEANKTVLTTALKDCHVQHQEELNGMKEHIAQYIDKCIQSQMQKLDEQTLLIEKNAEQQRKELSYVKSLTKQEVESLVQEIENKDAAHKSEAAGLYGRLIEMKSQLNDSTARQSELVVSHERLQRSWSEGTREFATKYLNDMYVLSEKHSQKNSARSAKRQEQMIQFIDEHDELLQRLNIGCKALEDGVRSQILTTEGRVGIVSTLGKTIIGDANVVSTQQLQDIETYIKKRKITATSGDTPVKANNQSFPLFQSTKVPAEKLKVDKNSPSHNMSPEHKRRRLSRANLVDPDRICNAADTRKVNAIVGIENNMHAPSDNSLRSSDPATDASGTEEGAKFQTETPVTPSKLKKPALLGLQRQNSAIAHASKRIKVSSASSPARKTKASALAVPKRYRAEIPGGYFAAKFGAKGVLIAGVVIWTLFDISTVIVARCLTCLFFTRAGMGLGEGILFPCMHQIAGAWYPVQERSRLVSLVASGSDLGTISALIISPAIMSNGWQHIFIVFGVLSFIWVVAYVFMGVSRPEDDPYITVREREYIVCNRTVDPVTHQDQQSRAEMDTHEMNWKVLLTSRPAWAIYTAHMCYNYSWYILLGWIPQYFNQVLNLDLTKRGGLAAALPYMCGYTGTILFGRLGDVLVTRGFRELHVRQTMNAISFLGCGFFLASLRLAKSVPVAVALLCMALFTSRAAMAGYWVNMIDVAPNHAAHVMGVSNTFGTIPGIIGNVVTGAILQATGSWDLVFAVATLVLVFGAAFFHCNASDRSIYARPNYEEGYISTSSTSSSFHSRSNCSMSLSSSIHDEQNSLLGNKTENE
ncbi:hypothetical protein PsorP6_008497 [Peronosclerospora sorghi]|uniref:Uncharacterized protein n=1 Tax=Peronosclerospora sorghi TaxID=230839 RepID=A0ACC0W8Y0_9STRA|nr:hypothetical protein PsorP6_008497 [Peronosclerospora sorghi]